MQGQAVSVRQYLTPRNGGRINVRVLVVDVIGLDLEIARFVLSVINVRIKPDRGAAASAIIQSKSAFNIVGDWKCELRQKGRSPGAQVSRRDGKTEGVVERLIHVRPPKDWNFSDVEGDVLKNDVVVFINSHRSCAQVKIGVRRIVRRECTIFDAIHVRRSFGHVLAAEEVRVKISARIARADLFSLDVINSALGDINANIAVNPDVAFY